MAQFSRYWRGWNIALDLSESQLIGNLDPCKWAWISKVITASLKKHIHINAATLAKCAACVIIHFFYSIIQVSQTRSQISHFE